MLGTLDTDAAERRVQARHAVPRSISLRAVDPVTEQVLGEVEDISPGGFKLLVTGTLRRRETVIVRIDVRIDGQDHWPIVARARNVWAHSLESDGAARAGFVFVELLPRSLLQIEAFIAEFGGRA